MPGAGNPQAWNRYSYTLNSPINFNDPTSTIVADNFNISGNLGIKICANPGDQLTIIVLSTPAMYQYNTPSVVMYEYPSRGNPLPPTPYSFYNLGSNPPYIVWDTYYPPPPPDSSFAKYTGPFANLALCETHTTPFYPFYIELVGYSNKENEQA